MRLQLVVFVVAALAVGAFGFGHHGRNGRLRSVFHQCANATEVDGDVLRAWVNRQPVEDDRLKCFLACVMKEAGAMTEDGQIDTDKIIARLPMHMRDRETKVESIEICSTKRGEDDCETAFLVATCFRRHHVFDRPRFSQFWRNVQKCKAETKVDPALLRAERRGEDVDDPQVKCFYACMMKRLNIMTDEGKVNVMKLIARIPEDDENREEKIELFSMCSKKKGTDECDTAYRIRRCIHKGLTKMFRSQYLPAITTTTEAPIRVPMSITSDNE